MNETTNPESMAPPTHVDGQSAPPAVRKAHHGPPIRPAANGQPTPHLHIDLPEAFAKLGLEPSILHALAEINFTKPSEIQEKMIPIALTGVDVIGQARTGTGKTAAFGLPIIQRTDLSQPFQTLILVPTRELAVQVEGELNRFVKHRGVRVQVVYGGTKVLGQIKLLGRQPHIVVGTPGRVIDLWQREALPLHNMKFVVCDEVDRMFDIGFRDDIRKILAACTAPHQTIFVSATISDEIERMVNKHMHNPQRVFTSNSMDTLTVPEAVQFYVAVNPWDKQRAIKMLLRAEKPALAIVFCRTKRSVDKVAHGLTLDGINASPIHGDLMQTKRERVMRGFRTGKINVLVATDLASRGIDVHEITHVINYDIPEDPEVYVHRVGRTARMGATGRAFTFIARGEAQMQTEIEKLINSLLGEYRIPNFVASTEPSQRAGYVPHAADSSHATTHTAHRPAQSAVAAPADGSTPDGTGTVLPPKEEGYAPTSFANVKPTAVRPLSGKYPTKRRR
jgi:ATP-dependent RNA helicase DeaD